jgi:uncharacterized protein (UPF0332 family)
MFDWNQYLLLAEKLFYLRKNEEFLGLKDACLRSAISRAYYAVFCVARNYLIDKKGIEIPKQDTHKFVREIFIESAIREEKIVGESIKQLWGKRKMADYEGSLTVTEGETEFCLKKAKDTLSLIMGFSK